MSDEFILDGKTCTRTDIQDVQKERYCPSGYTKVDMDVCINLNKTTNKEKGFICDYPDSRVVDDTCIIYDAHEAKNK